MNTDENEETLLEKLKKDDRITESVEVNMQTGKLSSNNIKRDVKINVPKNKDDIIKVVNLIDKKTKNKVELSENGIIITDKVAEILNVKKGDIVTLTDNNDIEYNLKVDGIVENYVDHYVYMSKKVAEKNFKDTKKRDKIKDEYCKSHNINLLRISYIDIKNNNYKNILSQIFIKE